MSEQNLTGYPSIDKPWLKYYNEEAINTPLPECTIYEYLWQNNREHLHDTALIYFGKKIDYDKLFANIRRVEKALREVGVTNGQVVTVNLPSIPETVYLFYALCKIGAVANMIDPRSDANMLTHYLNEAKSKVFIFLDKCTPVVNSVIDQTTVETAICVSAAESLPFVNIFACKGKQHHKTISWKKFIASGSNAAPVENDSAVDGDSPALMTHTSGTTSLPKGVVLSNKNINALAHQYKVAIEFQRGQRYLCVIPPFIAFGMCTAIHLPIALGVASVLIPKFEAKDFRKLLDKYKPEHWVCTPSNYELLIHDPSPIDLSNVITPAAGGDSMEKSYEQEINDYLKKHGCNYPVIKGYGMTEVGSSACTCWNACNKLGSVGIPLVNMTISIFTIGTTKELSYNDEGEICFTGPNMMLGYYKNPDDTAAAMKCHEDGIIWMHSGDIGYMTEDGHVYVVDRLKRAVTVDGQLVLPSKTERALLSHPDVEKCSVVGNSQSQLIAHIVLKRGADKNAVQPELVKTCVDQLPVYSLPVQYIFQDTLPLTHVGKVDYRALENEVQ